MPLSKSRVWLLLIVLSAVLVYLDYATPPVIQVVAALILPVMVATWYLGAAEGTAFGIVLPSTRLWFEVAVWHDDPLGTPFNAVLNFLLSSATFMTAVFLIDVIKKQRARLAARVSALESILPICSFCKKIRNQQGKWEQMEDYISKRTETMFSHGLCQECAKKHYPEVLA